MDTRCRACAVAVSAQTFRRLALANAVMLRRDRRDRRDGPPDRLRPRLRALAGLHGGRSVPVEGLPLRTSSSGTGSSRAFAIFVTLATWLASLLRAGGRSAGCAGSPAATFLGDLRCRRRSARSPSTTTSTPGSSARTSCSRSCVLALGVLVALEAWDVRGDAGARRRSAARARSPALACGALLVTGVLATAAGPHSGSDYGAARRRRSSRRCGSMSARRPCSGSPSPCCSPGSATRAAAAICAAASSLLGVLVAADDRRRDPVPDATAAGGSCSST